jgi:hypothetical protein
MSQPCHFGPIIPCPIPAVNLTKNEGLAKPEEFVVPLLVFYDLPDLSKETAAQLSIDHF